MLSSIFESFLRNTIVNLRNAVTLEFNLELITKHVCFIRGSSSIEQYQSNKRRESEKDNVYNSAINLILVSYTRNSR